MLGANEPLALKSAVAVAAGWPLAVQLVAAFQVARRDIPFEVEEAPERGPVAAARQENNWKNPAENGGGGAQVCQANRAKPICLKSM